MGAKITEVKASKKIVTNLGDYNSYHVGCELTAEVGKDEKVNWSGLWDEINQQLMIEQDNLDPSWIKSEEFKHHYKLTIKFPKDE